MFSAWQFCTGDYKPLTVFERNDCMVVTRAIEEIEEGQWKWEEYAMPKDVYETIMASTAILAHQAEQNAADIDYIATMTDIEL